MPAIALHTEDKVSTDLLENFRIFSFTHVFVGVALMRLVYFQLDVVSPDIVAFFLVYTLNKILITVSRHLTSKFLFW